MIKFKIICILFYDGGSRVPPGLRTAVHDAEGPVWLSALESVSKFWLVITMLNKVSLQNQLQNPCARNHEESNEVFDRVIRERLL